jgi:VanZ family protein
MSDTRAPAEPKSGFFTYVVPALIYVGAIFYSGLIAHAPGPHFKYGDKVMHFLAFGFMTLVVWRAVRFELGRLGPKRQVLLAFGIVVVLGAALEIAQMATATRSAELADWIADSVGAALVAFAIHRTRLRA